MADTPDGALLLWDAATIHGGPGRQAHQPPRDTVLLFSIDAALTAAEVADLVEDAGPRPLRIRVRGSVAPPPLISQAETMQDGREDRRGNLAADRTMLTPAPPRQSMCVD